MCSYLSRRSRAWEADRVSTFITRFDRPAGVGAGARRVAVKDLIDLAGAPTTAGSRAVAATAGPAAADAPCLAGTRAAEAAGTVVIVGKVNLHELAYGITGINPWFGTPVNPLDPARVPGGSSSGSAVAVAAGDADIAFGSDTGGSIRIPAACCGVVGLKTTWGRIPLGGVFALAPSLDTVGPMGRTVADVVAGMALLEPGFRPAAAPAVRIGRVRLAAEDRIDAAIDRALAAAGLAVTETPLPGWAAATAAAMTVLNAEAWATDASLYRDHAADLSPDVADRLAASSEITAASVGAARDHGRVWQAEVAAALAGVDLLALPTLAAPPAFLSEPGEMQRMRYVAPFNLAGGPALALPIPAAPGLPASLQLVGPAGSEELLLATGALVEAAVAL
jgi:amidase